MCRGKGEVTGGKRALGTEEGQSGAWQVRRDPVCPPKAFGVPSKVCKDGGDVS